MKPGEELDRLIAEKVMGFSFDQPIGWDVDDGYPDYVPSYSTDIAAAWKVIEKLIPMTDEADQGFGPQFELNIEKRDWDTKYWRAEFYDRWGRAGWKEPLNMSFGDTTSHAICLAALKAVGVTL